jgi:hypothetical protein
MADTETTGRVTFVKVNSTPNSSAIFELAGQFQLQPPLPPGTIRFTELFIVWWAPNDLNVPTGPQWMHRALQVSLLRDALLANKTVTVFHDDRSPFVNSLQVNA